MNDDVYIAINTYNYGHLVITDDIQNVEVDITLLYKPSGFLPISVKFLDDPTFDPNTDGWDDSDIDEVTIFQFKNFFRRINLYDAGLVLDFGIANVYGVCKGYDTDGNIIYKVCVSAQGVEPSYFPSYSVSIESKIFIIDEASTEVSLTGKQFYGDFYIPETGMYTVPAIAPFTEDGWENFRFNFERQGEPYDKDPVKYPTFFTKMNKLEDSNQLSDNRILWNNDLNAWVPVLPPALSVIEKMRYRINEIEACILKKQQSELTLWTDSDQSKSVQIYINDFIRGTQTNVYSEIEWNYTSSITSGWGWNEIIVNSFPYFQKPDISSVQDGEGSDNIGLPLDSKINKFRWTYIKEMREAVERIINEMYGGTTIDKDNSELLQYFLGDTDKNYSTEGCDRKSNYFKCTGGGRQRKALVTCEKAFQPYLQAQYLSDGTLDSANSYFKSRRDDFNQMNAGQYPFGTNEFVDGYILVAFGNRNGGYQEFSRTGGGQPDVQIIDYIYQGGWTMYKWFKVSANDKTTISSDEFVDWYNARQADQMGGYFLRGPAYGGEPEETGLLYSRRFRKHAVIMPSIVAIRRAGYVEPQDYRVGWCDQSYVIPEVNEASPDFGKVSIHKPSDPSELQDYPDQCVLDWWKVDGEIDYIANKGVLPRITLDNCKNFVAVRDVWLHELDKAIMMICHGLPSVIFDPSLNKFKNYLDNNNNFTRANFTLSKEPIASCTQVVGSYTSGSYTITSNYVGIYPNATVNQTQLVHTKGGSSRYHSVYSPLAETKIPMLYFYVPKDNSGGGGWNGLVTYKLVNGDSVEHDIPTWTGYDIIGGAVDYMEYCGIPCATSCDITFVGE